MGVNGMLTAGDSQPQWRLPSEASVSIPFQISQLWVLVSVRRQLCRG